MSYAKPLAGDAPAVVTRPSSPRWWQRPWILPLAAVVVLFVAFSLPPYLSLDPARSRVPTPAGFPAHYPLLVAHVIFGSVALLTAVLQVWPWLRQRHPAAHRRIGRVYVFGGVLPAGLLGLPVGAFGPFGPVARASNVLLAVVWLTATVTGYRMARRRRYADHRRWMIRSFALTASIITNRIWGVAAYLLLAPQLATTFHGDEVLFSWTIAGLSTWLGWVGTLLVAECWLEARGARSRAIAPV